VKFVTTLWFLVFLVFLLQCDNRQEQKNLYQLSEDFFRQHVPELPEARLLQMTDLPKQQQNFFVEAKGQLQLLADLNNNGTPEYIVGGVSDEYLRNKTKKPYFIAIFEKTHSKIERKFFQQVYIPPVTMELKNENDEPRIVISFAFYSDYGAEIYFRNNEYYLEKW
jgi:hypothetical protein